jgi:hypothetical protein
LEVVELNPGEVRSKHVADPLRVERSPLIIQRHDAFCSRRLSDAERAVNPQCEHPYSLPGPACQRGRYGVTRRVTHWTAMPRPEGEIPPDIAQLTDAIAEELNVQLNMLKHPMDFDDVDQVAYWVAVQLDYGYTFEPKPPRP